MWTRLSPVVYRSARHNKPLLLSLSVSLSLSLVLFLLDCAAVCGGGVCRYPPLKFPREISTFTFTTSIKHQAGLAIASRAASVLTSKLCYLSLNNNGRKRVGGKSARTKSTLTRQQQPTTAGVCCRDGLQGQGKGNTHTNRRKER
mmetsp:Transcript_14034/g.26979  ORF Transcript_14034/g.26979 Transcript_14034/m.26979 type:complete len:145 (-) Transcript_14034:158-592(-)